MTCDSHNKHPRRRCTICGVDWTTNEYFKTCPVCGEDTQPMCDDDPSPTWSESKRLEAELVAERNEQRRLEDEAAKVQAKIDAVARERTIRAATAALNYDLDRWMRYDPTTGLVDEELA